MKWGKIGTGSMGKIFADAINRSKDDILYAICSRNEGRAEEFAKGRNIPFHYGNFDEFLNNESIDVVYSHSSRNAFLLYKKGVGGREKRVV